jgi:hypothetical protein
VRVTILEVERDRLVDALREGKSWAEAKVLVPDVDPEVLDRGFEAWAHKEAGVELAEAPKEPKPPKQPKDAPATDASKTAEVTGDAPAKPEPTVTPTPRRGRAPKPKEPKPPKQSAE